MIFSNPPSFSVGGFGLRPLAHADIADWFAYLTQPVVHEHTSWDVQAPDELLPFVYDAASATENSMVRFAVVRNDSGRMVGTFGFHSLWWKDRRAEIAYDLSPQVWGQGLATSVANLMVAWAHEEVGFRRIQATVLDANARSRRVLEKCGFIAEGMLRSYRLVRGTPRDFLMYSHIG